MAPQSSGGGIDAADVVPYRLAVVAARQHEMAIVGLCAPQIVDHQIAAVRLHRCFETLDGRQQIREIFGALRSGHRNAALPQPISDFGSGTIYISFALVGHATT